MSKYSYEFKAKIVVEYLNGSLGYTLLAKKHGIKSCSSIKKWVNQFEQYGAEGLRSKIKKKKYSSNFKLDVLKYKQDTGASYKETANIFGISEPSVIANWKRKYISEGATGLNRSIGRPSKMAKADSKKEIKRRDNNQQNIDPSEIELELLKKENEYLKIEVEYLKKLKALGLKDPRVNNNPK